MALCCSLQLPGMRKLLLAASSGDAGNVAKIFAFDLK